MDNQNEYISIKDLFCKHDFICLNKVGKIVCEYCNMEAELYYERKFKNIMELIHFQLDRNDVL